MCKWDIRLTQLFIMAVLLAFGALVNDFDLNPRQVVLTFLSGIFAQFLFMRFYRIPLSLLSVLITCFGVSLLLRSDNLWVHPVAVFLAIAAKFLVRYQGRHLFNPANFAVILGLALLPGTWVTTGQWGADWVTAGWLIMLGGVVAGNARRLDISLFFLFFYSAVFILVRIVWYGYPIEVFFHQFQNGALLLFSFFMITDPMTIPLHRTGRLLHALVVAVLAYSWQYYFYWQQGILWALFIASPLVFVWNRYFPAQSFVWSTPPGDTHV